MELFSFFRQEIKGVHQAALLLALASLTNGFLGLFRDRLLAGSFGASRMLDIYYASFRIPDFIFSLSLFFVASTAFIPIFLERKNHSREASQDFLDSVSAIFFIVMAFALLVTYIALPRLMAFVAPGFDEVARQETLRLSRILLLSPLLLGFSNLISSILQSEKKFFAYALSPVLYNGGIILGILYFYPMLGPAGLAWGVILGAFFHVVIQVPALLHLGSWPRFRIVRSSNPWSVFRYSFPRALALSSNQLTLIVLTALASTLGAGAISIFNLSHNLFALPLTVVGLSYSVAAFPLMAELVLKKEKSLFFGHLVSASRHILFWTLPIAGLFIVFRAHIVRLVLGTGAFAWADTRLTAASLLFFSIAIVFQSLVTLFVRAYYALGKSRDPLIYNAISSISIIIIAFASVTLVELYPDRIVSLLSRLFRIQYPLDNLAFLAIPFAYTVGAGLNAWFLGTNIFRLNGKEEVRTLALSFRDNVLLSLVISTTAYGSLRSLGFMNPETFFSLALQAVVALGVALAVGVFFARIYGIREYFELEQALRARFVKKEILQPETEHM